MHGTGRGGQQLPDGPLLAANPGKQRPGFRGGGLHPHQFATAGQVLAGATPRSTGDGSAPGRRLSYARQVPDTGSPAQSEPTPEGAPRPRRVTVMGVGFDPLTEDEVVRRIVSDTAAGRGGWLSTPNVDILRQITLSEQWSDLVRGAGLVVADGMPIVWASRLAGTPLPERVAGSSLLVSVSAAAARSGLGVLLLGGRPGSAEKAARRLRDLFPDLEVGHHCPPMGFESSPPDRSAIDDVVEAFDPAVVFCGFGFPKQERLMADLHLRFPASWFLACGGGLDLLAGATRRAPGWAQAMGVEWVFRLAQEPVRLARRYLVDDLPFALRLLASSGLNGWGQRRDCREGSDVSLK